MPVGADFANDSPPGLDGVRCTTQEQWYEVHDTGAMQAMSTLEQPQARERGMGWGTAFA